MKTHARNELKASLFKGFSRQIEDVSLLLELDGIASGKHWSRVESLRMFLRMDAPEKAAHCKRQLRACTFSATYRERRVPENIRSYNDLVVLDLDGLDPAVVERCKGQMAADAFVLFAFVSPSGNGLKAGVRLATPQAQELRREFAAREEVTYGELEKYHKQMFDWCCRRYEELCGVEVDKSGSDVGRLCFLSHDPGIYLDTAALERLEPMAVTILPPAAKPKPQVVTGKSSLREELPENPAVDCSHIDTALQMEFQKCVSSVRRTLTYQPGQRDTFLYTLGNRCYKKNLPQEVVVTLAQRSFGGAPDIDVARTIGNAYSYTGKTDRAVEEERKPAALKVMDFMKRFYLVRRNEVLQRLEFRKKREKEAEWMPVKKHDYNSIFLHSQEQGIHCQPFLVKTVIDSHIAQRFNPFEDYFTNLPPWDGTDHIGQLAQTLETTAQEFWNDCFRRWMVGVVACALDKKRVNQLALVLAGEQGKGKSTWVQNLLPPELAIYYRNGMLNPSDKDHMLMLSQRLIINLEEFEGMKNGEIGELKRLIGQDVITERKAWDTDADFYIRRASFIASTNEPRFLADITGTRRFPTVTVIRADYRSPVNHTGVYSQAHALWKQGHRYWYEEEEFQKINAQNLHYAVSSAEEELFYVYYRKPLPNDLEILWMPVSSMLSYISMYGRVQHAGRNIRTLAKVLERDKFNKRLSRNNVWLYEVVQIDLGEVSRNFKGLPAGFTGPDGEPETPRDSSITCPEKEIVREVDLFSS